jgi:hypothetical protein
VAAGVVSASWKPNPWAPATSELFDDERNLTANVTAMDGLVVVSVSTALAGDVAAGQAMGERLLEAVARELETAS